LLSGLRRALRTEPNVRLAVLYGSAARGEADADSDLDILVELKQDNLFAAAGLRRRLEQATGREIGLARLPRARSQAPLLLAEVLSEGRVLVDRGNRWPELQAERDTIERRAQTAYREEMRATRAALERIEQRVGSTAS
jgi:predicted nucleotidyltransferase